jgi:hypothetical protein
VTVFFPHGVGVIEEADLEPAGGSGHDVAESSTGALQQRNPGLGWEGRAAPVFSDEPEADLLRDLGEFPGSFLGVAGASRD